MSQTLDVAAIASFDADVKKAYQTGSKLRASVRTKANVVGRTHRFPKIGKGLASQRVTQTEVIPMNVVHTNVTVTLQDWNAPEYTDLFDDIPTNIDEIQELSGTIAMAIGRREDQLIIDALEASATTLTVSNDIGGVDSDLNTAKVRRAKRLLDDQGVPSADRSWLNSALGLEALLGDSDADTFDKNAIKALFDGEIMHWVGFDFTMIETRTEGGLTVDGSNDRTNLAYHRTAVGLAIGKDMMTRVDWVATRTSWLSNGLFSAGSIAIDALGIVDITTRETP